MGDYAQIQTILLVKVFMSNLKLKYVFVSLCKLQLS